MREQEQAARTARVKKARDYYQGYGLLAYDQAVFTVTGTMKTADLGTCKACGAITSSGMDNVCFLCAAVILITAKEDIAQSFKSR